MQSADRVFVPCHNSPEGAPLSSLLADKKSIGILTRNGYAFAPYLFDAFTGVRGTQTGIRQAVSTNAQEVWVGGIASRNYGLRYLSSRTDNDTTRVHGSQFWQETPPRYQAGSLDLRGVLLYGSQVFITSSWVVERNRNMDKAPLTPWGGVIRIGEYGRLEREVTKKGELLRGFTGRLSFWTFMFENTRSMWLIEGIGTYSQASTTSADTFARLMGSEVASSTGSTESFFRPVYYRNSVRRSLCARCPHLVSPPLT